MAKVACLAALVASSSAFAPSAPLMRPASSMSSQVTMMAEKSASIPFMMKPKALDGTMPGDVGFDPLGLSDWVDIKFMAEAEIKHGRVCMLAVAGWIFADFVKLPGDVHAVSSLEAHDAAVKYGAMSQILLWTSAFEALSTPAVVQMMQGSGREPGYFGFDPLNFANTPAKMATMRLKEVKNGRLAMLAFSGIVTSAALSGKGFPYF